VYGYMRAFADAGVWESMRHQLVMMLREQGGREASPTAAIIDTQSVKTTEKDPMGRRVCGLGKVRVPALTPPEAVAWKPRLHPQHLPPTWSLPRCSWRWN
jgi:hypothetical protein